MPETLFFVNPEDPEWDTMWSLFDLAWLNSGPDVLRYMGTKQAALGYVHQFSHRWHPETEWRHLWAVCASEGWQPRELVMEQHLARLGA